MDKFVLWIGRVLLLCLFCSFVLLIYGGVLYFMQHSHDIVQFNAFTPEPHSLNDIKDIFYGSLQGDPLHIIQLGVISVVLGQLARILLTSFLFIYEKDKYFTAISLLIFFLAGHSLFAAL